MFLDIYLCRNVYFILFYSSFVLDYPCRSPHMKQCKDGHCIAMYFFCDRENDCGDWSDELNCTGMVIKE